MKEEIRNIDLNDCKSIDMKLSIQTVTGLDTRMTDDIHQYIWMCGQLESAAKAIANDEVFKDCNVSFKHDMYAYEYDISNDKLYVGVEWKHGINSQLIRVLIAEYTDGYRADELVLNTPYMEETTVVTTDPNKATKRPNIYNHVRDVIVSALTVEEKTMRVDIDLSDD